MLPAIAAHAITAYTQRGDLVLDPMCGIGTTLVEAAHLGRDAAGVEFEGRWCDIAAANIRLAHTQGACGRAMVVRGDATTLTELIPAALHGRFALVVTSPPYGPTVHGLVRPSADGVHKSANRYSEQRDPGNLAHRDWSGLVDGFTQILRGCHDLLRPGGTVVVTARPWRRNGELVDLPSAVFAAGLDAGLIPVERCVALLAALRDGRLVPRPSFFQLQQVRRARGTGIPMHLIAHEDVLVVRRPPTSAGSREPKCSRSEDGGRPVLACGHQGSRRNRGFGRHDPAPEGGRFRRGQLGSADLQQPTRPGRAAKIARDPVGGADGGGDACLAGSRKRPREPSMPGVQRDGSSTITASRTAVRARADAAGLTAMWWVGCSTAGSDMAESRVRTEPEPGTANEPGRGRTASAEVTDEHHDATDVDAGVDPGARRGDRPAHRRVDFRTVPQRRLRPGPTRPVPGAGDPGRFALPGRGRGDPHRPAPERRPAHAAVGDLIRRGRRAWITDR